MKEIFLLVINIFTDYFQSEVNFIYILIEISFK